MKIEFYFNLANQSNLFIEYNQSTINEIIDGVNDIKFTDIIQGLILKSLTRLLEEKTNKINIYKIISRYI